MERERPGWEVGPEDREVRSDVGNRVWLHQRQGDEGERVVAGASGIRHVGSDREVLERSAKLVVRRWLARHGERCGSRRRKVRWR